MKNTFKLGRKFMLLAVMLVGTGFAISTNTSAAASLFCCSDCDADFYACIDNGGTPAECNQQTRFCYRHCDPTC